MAKALNTEQFGAGQSTTGEKSDPMRDKILNIIYTELEKVNDEKITLSESTDITTDMNVDSVAIMDLMFELEESFDVSVPLNDLADIRTIGQLADLIASLSNTHSA